MKILIIGAGRMADYLIRENPEWQFIAIRRTQQDYPDNVAQCPMQINPSSIMKLNAFESDWLIYMPKTLSASDNSYKEAYVEIPEQLLKLEIKNKLFISSTRVFNGYRNINVDEKTAPKPNDSLSGLIAEFENNVLQCKDNKILRLSGIVNEESNFIKAMLKRAENDVVDNKFINAIHVEDVAKIIQEQVNLLNKSQIINGVVPSSERYSDFSKHVMNNDPVNANVQSLQYNSNFDFKYKDIKSLL